MRVFKMKGLSSVSAIGKGLKSGDPTVKKQNNFMISVSTNANKLLFYAFFSCNHSLHS